MKSLFDGIKMLHSWCCFRCWFAFQVACGFLYSMVTIWYVKLASNLMRGSDLLTDGRGSTGTILDTGESLSTADRCESHKPEARTHQSRFQRQRFQSLLDSVIHPCLICRLRHVASIGWSTRSERCRAPTDTRGNRIIAVSDIQEERKRGDVHSVLRGICKRRSTAAVAVSTFLSWKVHWIMAEGQGDRNKMSDMQNTYCFHCLEHNSIDEWIQILTGSPCKHLIPMRLVHSAAWVWPHCKVALRWMLNAVLRSASGCLHFCLWLKYWRMILGSASDYACKAIHL